MASEHDGWATTIPTDNPTPDLNAVSDSEDKDEEAAEIGEEWEDSDEEGESAEDFKAHVIMSTAHAFWDKVFAKVSYDIMPQNCWVILITYLH